MAKKFNLQKEKEKMEKKNSYTVKIEVEGDTAIALKAFTEHFKPPQVSEQEFFLQLLLMGAEMLQDKLRQLAMEQARKDETQQQNDDKAESQIIIP